MPAGALSISHSPITPLSSLIVHPDVERSRARIAALREQLHALFSERIGIRFDLFPRLRNRYAELFGDLERAVQERTLELSERRRMVELFSLKIDRGQKLDARTVELVMKAVRNEFGRVRARMQAAFSEDRRRHLDGWQPPPGVPGEHRADEGTPHEATGARRRAEEIRDLYRSLAKRLHPDSQQDANGPRREYWDLVQRGYREGDLPLLRTLASLATTLDAADGASPAAEEERLAAALRLERAGLDQLKRDELYHMRTALDDERWIAARRSELQLDVADLDAEIATCDRFLAPILSGKSVPTPEIVKNIWSSFVDDVYINNR